MIVSYGIDIAVAAVIITVFNAPFPLIEKLVHGPYQRRASQVLGGIGFGYGYPFRLCGISTPRSRPGAWPGRDWGVNSFELDWFSIEVA